MKRDEYCCRYDRFDGTTRNELDEAAKKADVAVFIAPNFSVGAVLMMKYSAEIAKYLPDVEIIELHHNNKLDAPSGTAKMTAEKITRARREAGAEPAPDKTHESLAGARGATVEAYPYIVYGCPGMWHIRKCFSAATGKSLRSVTTRWTENPLCPALS